MWHTTSLIFWTIQYFEKFNNRSVHFCSLFAGQRSYSGAQLSSNRDTEKSVESNDVEVTTETDKEIEVETMSEVKCNTWYIASCETTMTIAQSKAI